MSCGYGNRQNSWRFKTLYSFIIYRLLIPNRYLPTDCQQINFKLTFLMIEYICIDHKLQTTTHYCNGFLSLSTESNKLLVTHIIKLHWSQKSNT